MDDRPDVLKCNMDECREDDDMSSSIVSPTRNVNKSGNIMVNSNIIIINIIRYN